MELRNRTIGEDNSPDMEDEEEALIEPDGDGVKNTEDKKSGIAGDERNILVLLFLYILQVLQYNVSNFYHIQIYNPFTGNTSWAGSSHTTDPDKQKCELQATGRV